MHLGRVWGGCMCHISVKASKHPGYNLIEITSWLCCKKMYISCHYDFFEMRRHSIDKIHVVFKSNITFNIGMADRIA